MRTILSGLVQIGISLVLVAVAIAIWVTQVPSAMPWLERAGILDRLGIDPAAPEGQVAGPSGGGGGGGPPGGASGGPGATGGPGGPGPVAAAGGGRPGGPPGDRSGGAPGGPPAAAAGGGPGGGGFGGGGPGGRGGPAGPVTVVAAPVGMVPLGDRLTAIGDAAALRSVTAAPQVSGLLTELPVTSGSYVAEGSTIARIDDAAERIALDRAQLLLADARATVARLSALGTAATAVQRAEAELALRTAELNVQEAELDVARRTIGAPISGWVGLIEVTPGDQVGPGTTLMRIDDRSEVVVQFRVPERFAPRLSPGDPVAALPLALPGTRLDGVVRALDSRVDEASRTLRVEAVVPNVEDRLRPGMALRIEIAFAGEPALAVDPRAIQWGSGGAFVWAVREGKATRVPVRILRRDETAVLVEGELTAGDTVVVEGAQGLRPGSDVALRTADAGTAPVAPTPAVFRPDAPRPTGG
ncbi:MAG: efflux RND transporter periplasmic adaptor subunit [Rhodobacteraceae bacterium]|nr:efflux RND transporter periplasmic adaptor subunit [Paracoccaceae bacterium]